MSLGRSGRGRAIDSASQHGRSRRGDRGPVADARGGVTGSLPPRASRRVATTQQCVSTSAGSVWWWAPRALSAVGRAGSAGSFEQSSTNRGGDSARAVRDVELVVDAGEMGLDGGRGDVEPGGDLAGRATVGGQRQDLALPLRDALVAAVAVTDGERQARPDARREDGLAERDRQHRVAERRGADVLADITGRAASERAEDDSAVDVVRDKNEPGR